MGVGAVVGVREEKRLQSVKKRRSTRTRGGTHEISHRYSAHSWVPSPAGAGEREREKGYFFGVFLVFCVGKRKGGKTHAMCGKTIGGREGWGEAPPLFFGGAVNNIAQV